MAIAESGTLETEIQIDSVNKFVNLDDKYDSLDKSIRNLNAKVKRIDSINYLLNIKGEYILEAAKQNNKQASNLISVVETLLAFIGILLAGFTIIGIIEVRKIKELANKLKQEISSLNEQKVGITKEIETLKSESISEGKELLEVLFYMTEGDIHKDGGNYEDAINYYKQALKVRENNPEIYLKLGKLYTQIGEYGKAINFLEEGHRFSKTNRAILNRLGRAYRKMHNFSKAEFYYKEALKIDEKYLWALSGLSMVCIGQENYSDAEMILNKISLQEENSFHSYMNLGVVYICLKSDKYKEKFREALRLLKLRSHNSNENTFWVDGYRVVILSGLGRYEDALKILDILIDNDVRYNSMKSVSDRINIIVKFRKSSKLKAIKSKVDKWFKNE